MNFRVGNGRLGALLLAFLCHFTFCYSAPHNAVAVASSEYDHHVSPSRSLAKRNDYSGFLVDLRKATRVGQDDEKFIAWGATEKVIAMDGFMGCIGMTIVGDSGAIMAHYGDADTSIRRAQTNLPGLISQHKQALTGATAYLLAEVKLNTPNTYVSEANNLKLIDIVQSSLGITPERVKYVEPESFMVDEYGQLLDDCPEELLYGAAMVKDLGFGKGGPQAIFIDADWQAAAAANS
ncbi:uncharacterized protein N7459_001628 [Penicillium hispanicum]|uniref:uncharacterized protein n=1 Tax=Penicillium hispanicum TaxID=1080232 RepID=UPI002541142A|nr:uncharacterized protein N7459_001628 [Penicillium hispanicum]KAJ5595420.1 hypothetical protein N7459_001628 [Penicillium hispanicum]